MSALAELQRCLQTHVLQPASAPIEHAAQSAVITTAAADSAQRLGIYTYAYRARLLETLGNDYPGLRELAGAEAFEQLGRSYIESTPSTYWNVRWYGGALAGHLANTPPWSAQTALAEMASFEWRIGLAFDASDEAVVDVAEVARVAPQDWPQLRLRLHASLQRQALGCNVNEMRRAVDHAEALPALHAFEPVQPWVVWRKDLSVRYRRLELDEAAALDAVAEGANFTELCELLCTWHAVDAVAMRAATLFRLWIEDQWVSSLE